MKCEICGLNSPTYTCKICGRKVCANDYDKNRGYCLVCREAICELCGVYLSIGVCKYCGKLGCEKCLVQVSLIEYVCINCYRKGLR